VEKSKNRSRIRRAKCLVAFWEDGEFVIQNYLSNKQTETAPLVARLLDGLDEYLPVEHVLKRLGSMSHAEELVDKLIRQDVLVAEGSLLDRKECSIDKTWTWTHEARFFHYSTQHVSYEADPKVQRTDLVRLACETPPPPPFKDYGRSDMELTGTFDERAGDFWDVLRTRRTIRSFARRAIPFEDFSTLLLWTWGYTHLITDPQVGQYVLKTSPSGGARHPTEVYPVVLRVDGIEPGIYHYSVKNHGLELLRLGIFEDLVVRLCARQEWVRDAAAVFFMTAALTRNMWKYDHARAYRVLLLETGHLGQTFHLVCTKLGLAPFTTAASLDTEIERELSLDGVSETPTYTAAVGIPAKT
jgi:SagB-type dehydrogenase family enzyme